MRLLLCILTVSAVYLCLLLSVSRLQCGDLSAGYLLDVFYNLPDGWGVVIFTAIMLGIAGMAAHDVLAYYRYRVGLTDKVEDVALYPEEYVELDRRPVSLADKLLFVYPLAILITAIPQIDLFRRISSCGS